MDVNGTITALLNRLTIFSSGEERVAHIEEVEEIANNLSLMKDFSPETAVRCCADFEAAIAAGELDTVAVTSLVLANSCIGDDQRIRWALLADSRIVAAVQDFFGKYVSPAAATTTPATKPSPSLLKQTTKATFHVLDLVATLSTNNGDFRSVFRETLPGVVNSIRCFKTSLDVLFAASCTVATLTIADTLNGKEVVQCNGMQVMLEVFKYCAKLSKKQQSEEDAELCAESKRWSKQALLNLMKAPFDLVDEKLAAAKFGTFGDVLEVDELKWSLQHDRKNTLKLLESFRATKKGSQ